MRNGLVNIWNFPSKNQIVPMGVCLTLEATGLGLYPTTLKQTAWSKIFTTSLKLI